jgi:hypothetical protein
MLTKVDLAAIDHIVQTRTQPLHEEILDLKDTVDNNATDLSHNDFIIRSEFQEQTKNINRIPVINDGDFTPTSCWILTESPS